MIVVEPKLDTELASTPGSPEPSFSQAFDEENMSNSKWKLATLENVKNLYLPGFEEKWRVIEEALVFWPNPWQINGLLNVKNGRDTMVLAGIEFSKSLLIQALPIINKNTIVLVIIPTLTLMENQLQSIKKEGTSVIALNSSTIVANPQV